MTATLSHHDAPIFDDEVRAKLGPRPQLRRDRLNVREIAAYDRRIGELYAIPFLIRRRQRAVKEPA